jgi:hypothetical protein
MKLLSPNPGEAIDRQMVCWVKAEQCEQTVKESNVNTKTFENQTFTPKARIDPKQFVDEINALQKHLLENWFILIPKTNPLSTQLDKHISDLKTLHTRLYQLNNQLRSLHKAYNAQDSEAPSPREVQLLAFQITDLNDARANIVFEINKLFGCPTVEKLYGLIA